MKRSYLIIWILVILVTACSNEEAIQKMPENPDNQGKSKAITFSQKMEGVSVLIFSEKGNDFNYKSGISSGWSIDGKVSTRLVLGKYKFLFMKSAGANTALYPDPLDEDTSFDQIEITTSDDSDNPGYVLPVDEIWLPETEEMADSVYTILEETTVKNTLTRAVSQIVLNIKRAAINGTDTTYLPLANDSNILADMENIKLEISNIGERINIEGGTGSVKTIYNFDQSLAKIDDDGFAALTGPFVFPTVDHEKASVKITITPSTTAAFPKMETTVQGKIERNKQLEINLLVTATYQLIDIIVDVQPITDREDGDIGIWE